MDDFYGGQEETAGTECWCCFQCHANKDAEESSQDSKGLTKSRARASSQVQVQMGNQGKGPSVEQTASREGTKVGQIVP